MKIRTVVRVVTIKADEIDVDIPGWNYFTLFSIPKSKLPPVQKGDQFIVCINLNLESLIDSSLEFEKIETDADWLE